ncbi:hypothetical protein FACS189472_03280 [Alphaproteobacteria bacterium]|nr:hypothetical protein FACS189472_03280 [Alphaproteobacteria bacterium]
MTAIYSSYMRIPQNEYACAASTEANCEKDPLCSSLIDSYCVRVELFIPKEDLKTLYCQPIQ